MTNVDTQYSLTIHDRDDIDINGNNLLLTLVNIDKQFGKFYGFSYRTRSIQEMVKSSKLLVAIGNFDQINKTYEMLESYGFIIEICEV